MCLCTARSRRLPLPERGDLDRGGCVSERLGLAVPAAELPINEVSTARP